MMKEEQINSELVKVRKMMDDIRLIKALCSQTLAEVTMLKERFDIHDNKEFLKETQKEASQ